MASSLPVGCLLTNHHVLDTPSRAATSAADLGYEQDLTGRVQTGVSFGLEPDMMFVTDSTLDYTLVAVHPYSTSGATLMDWDGVG
jgi:hypothetical protein